MPMVAAGLITDDPTLLPIRRLMSFVWPCHAKEVFIIHLDTNGEFNTNNHSNPDLCCVCTRHGSVWNSYCIMVLIKHFKDVLIVFILYKKAICIHTHAEWLLQLQQFYALHLFSVILITLQRLELKFKVTSQWIADLSILPFTMYGKLIIGSAVVLKQCYLSQIKGCFSQVKVLEASFSQLICSVWQQVGKESYTLLQVPCS